MPISPQLTLLDIRNHLYANNTTATTFNVVEDGPKLKLGQAYDSPKGAMAQYKDRLLRQALADMAKEGLIMVLDGEQGVCVLMQPIGSAVQQVVISPYTAQLVGEAFNLFARESGIPCVANKMAITDAEISAVVQVAFTLHARAAGLEAQIEDMLFDPDDDDLGSLPPGATPLPPPPSDPKRN